MNRATRGDVGACRPLRVSLLVVRWLFTSLRDLDSVSYRVWPPNAALTRSLRAFAVTRVPRNGKLTRRPTRVNGRNAATGGVTSWS
jgi:hypothetical protein